MSPPWYRRALRIFAVGVLPGVLVYAAMFALSVGFHASAEYMGVEDKSVSDRVMALFHDQIIAQQLGVLAWYLGLGAALGLVMLGALRARDAVFQRAWRGGWSTFAAVFGAVLFQHLALLVASMAKHPAIYAYAGEQLAPMGWLLDVAVDVLPRWLAAVLPWVLPASGLVFGAVLVVRDPPEWIAHRRAPAVALALGIAGGVAAVVLTRPPRLAPHATHGARSGHPNVIVLAVDSLRADLLTDHPEAVPNLTALSRQATTFTRAIPTVPRTYPSWASMLTGRYPHDHGIRHMFPVPPEHPNGLVIEHGLPELFGQAGYRTGVVSDFAGDVFRRGDWGFGTADTPSFTLSSNVALGGLKLHLHLMPWLVEVLPALGIEPYREELSALERLADPDRVVDGALDFVAEDPDRPFFLVAFFSAGHFPFASPSPFWDRFADPDYRGRSRFLKQSFGAALEGAEFEAEKRHLFDLYRGAVAASDDAIGRLLRALAEGGALDDTIVVVTADHGENLYENGLGMGHGDHLYGRTTLEVPLVLDYPGNPRRGQRFEMPVTLADVGPTLAGLAGVPLPLPAAPDAGVDLTKVTKVGGDALAHRPIFSEIDLWFFPPETTRLDHKRIVGVEGFAGFTFDPKSWAIYLDPKYQALSVLQKHRMVLADGRKLLYVPTREGVRWELYDPIADPGDLHDLSQAEPERLAALQSILWRWMLADPTVHRVGEYLVPRTGAMP